MKKFYVTMTAMLCGVAAMAQTFGTLSCENVTATAGGETAYVEVKLSADDVTAISGIGFTIGLPDGVSIARYYDEDEEDYLDDVSFPIAKNGHQKGIMSRKENGVVKEGWYLVYLAGDYSQTFRTTTDVVLKLGLNVPEDATNGTYDIVFQEIAMSDKSDPTPKSDGEYQVDFTATLTITGGTGINGINAADSNAPIYNVAGQRVSKAEKGVFIQNGKKVAVK